MNQHAAPASEVEVRTLHSAAEMTEAAEVLAEIWSPGGTGEAPMEPGLLIAMEHAGNYVSAAFSQDQMIGATAGFFGAPDSAGRSWMMHSHIAGVLPAHQGLGAGAAMKQHQRQWCLQRGVTVMEWTFDPLITRNARFNLHTLGAQLVEYLPHFYGQMRDATNAGQGSDRALIRWQLDAPTPGAEPEPGLVLLNIDDDGVPVPAHGSTEQMLAAAADYDVVGLSVPKSIPQLRAERPEASAAWRSALREAMHPLMEAGWKVCGMTPKGMYLLQRG
ncbi:hypothetical protein HGQ17_10855 [Nesterenkonia sp. MY13]|uniref:GNAT family N-acetyltransferase n=1 Tax=Nesterenkonia sedimenti TaxID=1463632 RepID=A0A7X8YEC1_9MICC|nr:hypothetical protein [Nesterenkonia sedimenti]NLS10479.1 hypothetical protein [Nesterenkonia sedimenti]